MTVAIYTCVSNGYDSADPVPHVIADDIEVYESFPQSVVNPRRVSYWWKYHPQLVLPDHIEYSIWIDGNMTIVNPDFVDMCLEACNRSAIGWAAWEHPSRMCIYQEYRAIVDMNLTKWPIDDLMHQTSEYQAQGYPEFRGLYALGCIARKHGENSYAGEFDQEVWYEMEKWNGSMDQVVVPYVEWSLKGLYGDEPIATFNGRELDGTWITLAGHAPGVDSWQAPVKREF